jgi:hypothetical protein
MPSSFSKAVRKLRTNPFVVGIIVVGTLLIALANTGRSLSELRQLWTGWTQQYPALETTWHGSWMGRDGHKFLFAMQLEVAANDAAEGYISWQLVSTPAGSHLAHRVGAVANEFVKGRFDRRENIAIVEGYDVSDPTLLALDSYKLQIRPDKTFVGMTKHRGDWEAQASGNVIVVAKR